MTNVVDVIAPRIRRNDALALLEGELCRITYPTHDLSVQAFGQEKIENEAALTANSLESQEPDASWAGLPPHHL